LRDVDAIRRLLPLKKVLVQELIPDDGTNKTISFCAFCVDGDIKAHWMGEKLRQHPWRFGTATFARSIRVEDCLKHSEPLLRALDYTGICEVEYLRDPRDGQYKLIEINPRTWLWVGLARACGVDFAMMVYRYLNGMSLPLIKNQKTELKWINFVTDTYISFVSIVGKKLNILDYLKSFRGETVWAVFSTRDPVPFLRFISMLFYLRKRRHF
jgi:D-aspartate ligase